MYSNVCLTETRTKVPPRLAAVMNKTERNQKSKTGRINSCPLQSRVRNERQTKTLSHLPPCHPSLPCPALVIITGRSTYCSTCVLLAALSRGSHFVAWSTKPCQSDKNQPFFPANPSRNPMSPVLRYQRTSFLPNQ